MASTRRHFLKLASATLAAPAISRSAWAADWPKEKMINATVPFGAGSSIDILGRIVADKLSQRLGQTIVIENRGGAGGSIGTAQVARADPDGYTWLIHASAHTIAPAIYRHLSYDAAKDFSGVALFGSIPNVLLVPPSKGIKTVQELVARAKTKDLTFSSAGIGSASHWSAERFRVAAGFKATHIPYRGGADALTEVIAGRVDFCAVGITSALAFIKGGQLLPLAVITKKRSPSLPDVVTTVEAGYKDSDYNFWNGLLLPAKTPRPIVDRLYTETTAVLAMPDVQEKLAVQGVEPSPVTPAQFDAQIRKEIAENIKIAQAAGVQQH